MRIWVEEPSRHDEPGRPRLAQIEASGRGRTFGTSHVYLDVTDEPMLSVSTRPCAFVVTEE